MLRGQSVIHLDFETRSEVDIKDAGAWRYAEHPSTSIICLAVARDDNEPKLYREHEIPAFIKAAKKYEDDVWVAHNAQFEMAIIENLLVPLGFKKPDPKQWRCTAASAAYNGLPRSLAEVGKALNLSEVKDAAGTRLLKQISVPRKDGSFLRYEDDPQVYEDTYAYNLQDVRTEQAVERAIGLLPPYEQRVWELDYEINRRGFRIDRVLAGEMLRLSHEYKELNEPFVAQLTDGEVQTSGQVQALLDWLWWAWVPLDNLQKSTIESALLAFEHNFPGADPRAKELLQARLNLASAAVTKYKAALRQVSDDDRVRGCFLYHGANTGRWSGKGLQPQNLKRPVIDIAEAVDFVLGEKPDITEFQQRYPQPLKAVASCTRGVITASLGKKLIGADFSAIEARVLAWLVSEDSALAVFENGQDPYCVNAETIFGYPANKKDNPDERQTGKVAELSLGYQGGIAAFVGMAKNYDLDLAVMSDIILKRGGTPDERERAERAYEMYAKRSKRPLPPKQGIACDLIKQRWRAARPKTVEFWHAVQEAAECAARSPGTTVPCARVSFRRDGSYLKCRLPSGRDITYFRPTFRDVVTPWEEEKQLLVYDSGGRKDGAIEWKGLYGGLLTENIVQAIARDLLVEAVLRLEDRGYSFVLHVHDEAVAEIDERGDWGDAAEDFKTHMSTPPLWARGLPLAAEPWIGDRYQK